MKITKMIQYHKRFPSKLHNSRLINLFSSIQVNMDFENFKTIEETSKKRQRKKQYRRRKKEKIRQIQKEAKLQLVMIIEQLYKRQTCFSQQYDKIESCLRKLQKDNKFHSFLDEVIKMHVKNIQKEIWEYTQTIIHQNPFENQGSHRFYYLMVNKIYEQYQLIRRSSLDIEHIISMHMRISTGDRITKQQEAPYKDLDKNTFNYLIQSDQTLKSLMRIFHQHVDPNYCPTRIKLNLLLDMLQEFDFTESQQQQNEHSTSIQQQQDLQRNSRRKKNKKKKVKDNDITPEFKDVMDKLQSFIIDQEDRTPCRVHNDWLTKLQNQLDLAISDLK